ncbi:hypothetical protein D9M68_904820 [compost metagenome]
MLLFERCHRLGEGLTLRHVATKGLGQTSACADLLDRLLGAVQPDVEHAHQRAHVREALRNGAADALRAAGDQRHLVLQARFHRLHPG